MSRQITSRGTSTHAGAELEGGHIFGPNISTQGAIKVANGIRELLELSTDSLLTVGGEPSDLADRLKRASSGCYYMTHMVNEFQGAKATGLILASMAMKTEDSAAMFMKHEMPHVDLNDQVAMLYSAILT